ncbi:MAG: hypothetical protein ACPGUX_06550 [Halocynthiibacter sp.]
MSEQMTLLVTSGNGPEECCQAVAHILQRMQAEADEMGADLDISGTPSDHGMKSAVVVVHGPLADRFALAWCGSIRWICKSDLRKGYKRQNWFAGVIRLPDLSAKVQGTEGFVLVGLGGSIRTRQTVLCGQPVSKAVCRWWCAMGVPNIATRRWQLNGLQH